MDWVRTRLTRSGLIIGAVTLFVAVAAVLPAAAKAQGPGFSWAGHCVEATVFVPMKAAQVREQDPGIGSRAMVGEASGWTLGAVGQGQCTEVSIDGEPTDGFSFSEVGVPIESPDGSWGSHVYNVWSLVDLPVLHARSCGLGACFPLVSELSFGRDGIAPGVVSLETATEWRDGSYGISATIPETFGPPVLDHGPVAWKSGHRGLIRTPFTVTDEADTGGPGELWAEPRSPLARMLGAERVVAQVFLREFDFRATAALVAA